MVSSSGPRCPRRSESPPAGKRGEGGGEVVDDVEADPQLGSGLDAVLVDHDVGDPQDQQRRSDIADLERGEAGHGPPELPAQNGTNLKPQFPALAGGGQLRLPDRVDDRERGEQAGDDRDQDRGPNVEGGDQPERE